MTPLDFIPGGEVVQRIAAYLLVGAALLATGFVKGCQYEQADAKEAATVFVERVKVVKEIERVEVPKFVKQIEWLTHTETQLIEAAKNDTPNPASCDFSPDRLQRLRLAATGNPE